ncbi:MAG TPA: fused response regulator/phosphatase [Spirochaetales bacterium]|nr:fused response regulator/phosphatase [Spirochaetales bacterium]HRY55301.1 fused response regulator/phosphatase [Spirochaetia bacterium]HRZ64343.1 fused response regulator/phosphatase [Spirochaetia bacterium]
MDSAAYTVLVVDDSAANRAFFAQVLEEEGYRILQAGSGEECLELAARERPVLILLDVVMPGIDGFEALRRLKAGHETRRSSVIMLTSLDDQESKLKAFDYGAVDYIVKSANEAEVRARVRVHVRLALANEELVAARAESIRQIAQAQRSLLVEPAELPEARFSVFYRSLHEAGGDFYEVLPVAEGVHFYLVADVAGHEVATSYATPAVKVLLSQFATPAYSVEETIGYMNGVLARTILEDTYLTAFALRINRRAGKAVILAAGHPPALYLPREGPVRFAECENPFIGVFEDTGYRSESLDVAEGDRFVLYTDGLVELAGEPGSAKQSWVFAREGLLPLAERLRGLPLGELPAAFVREMGAERIEDDVAVLAVEV